MISQETKDQIENESRIYLNEVNRKIYVVTATKYAEKIVEKDEIIESKDLELAELKDLVNYYKDKADKGESILRSAASIDFKPGSEGANQLESARLELAHLSEIIKRLNEQIHLLNRDAVQLYPFDKIHNSTKS